MNVVLPRSKHRAEPDGGYEESHGYGPSHGGPTGPGDAPAIGERGVGTAPHARPVVTNPKTGKPKKDRRGRHR